MKEKYYLLNNYLPCMCNCHLSCLRKDLINQGYVVLSLRQISKREYDNRLSELLKTGDYRFNFRVF